jgi:hypothetical protein
VNVTSATQRKLPASLVSYWVSVFQLVVYALAAAWLVRNVLLRGFTHTAGAAVGAMQNTP